jgi:hypothetical protein
MELVAGHHQGTKSWIRLNIQKTRFIFYSRMMMFFFFMRPLLDRVFVDAKQAAYILVHLASELGTRPQNESHIELTRRGVL